MTVVEMVAYHVMHVIDFQPWRCVVCDEITKHTEEGISKHLVEAHGYDEKRLKTDKDGIFLYPSVPPQSPGCRIGSVKPLPPVKE